ncbi:peptidase [Endozoicomonas sp. (ex Bugula neritina AB1)]|nr:peptidase [Endozoicomonas sp. (ex Bugula neritina AB1)]
MKRSIKFFRFIAWSTLMSISGALLVSASAYLYLSPSLPSVETLRDARLQTPLRVYSKDGMLIAEFGEKRRTPIQFEDAPDHMIWAFMAAEDDRFYSHPGVDVMGLMRAAVQLVSTGRIQSGGSTITMQVAKNFFLSHERVFSRKFNEILLALQIERELTKDEIFELYLNKIYLGNRAYGVEAAAQVYYDKSIDELNLAQIAMIAGLPKAPSRYNPINDPDRALIRRDWILGRMQDLDYIDDIDYQQAINQPITASYHGSRIELQAPYVAEMVRQEMVERFGPEAYTEGFRVNTTVDSKLQLAANKAVTDGLMKYTEKHGYQGPVTNLFEDSTIDNWQKALNSVPSISILHPAVVTAVEDQQASISLKDGETSVIDWDNLKWAKRYISVNSFGNDPKLAEDILKPGDQIWVRKMPDEQWRLAQEPDAQAALISLNPENGGVLALVGGFNFYDSMYNRVTQAVRQAGSSFKPFIYSSALANGMTAATIVNDAPVVFADDGLEDSWRPNNDNMKFNGPTRLREALYRSRNLVSIRILRQVGINNTINFLKKLGLNPDSLARDLSLALGNVSMTPMEMATGYSVLANGGYQIEPFLINRVDTIDQLYYQAEPLTVCRICETKTEPESHDPPLDATTNNLFTALTAPLENPIKKPAPLVMSPQVNYIINDILHDVIWKGTGRRARVLNRHDLGGKTGTTNDNKDVWFMGFNPDVLTGVWMGMDNYSTLGRWEYGSNVALPIWIDFMQVALKGKPEHKLTQPEGLVTLKINSNTGKLASQGDPKAIFEIFREDSAPQQTHEDIRPSINDSEQDFSPENLF